MRIATWNVNSIKARLPRVVPWLEEHDPDVLCMQETKQADAAFDATPFEALGYEVAHHGDGRWNGVAIASRVGLDDIVRGFEGPSDDAGTRLVAATCDGIRVHSVYVPNGRELSSEWYPIKLAWLEELRALLAPRCAAGEEVLVAGDFNVAPGDLDVWDPAALEGMTHVSAAEREAVAALLDLGLVDAVPTLHPGEQRFSWWDYRGGSFHKNHGMRIDLVLLSSSLATSLREAGTDREARKGEKPSDHAPVVVDLDR